jgi:inhibitor of cysteine peptidase
MGFSDDREVPLARMVTLAYGQVTLRDKRRSKVTNRGRLVTWMIGAAALLLLLSACSSSSTVQVGPSDNGTTVNLSEGDTLEVQLEGNPTTGFNWQVTDTINTSVLEQDGDSSYDADDDRFGSQGVVTVTFKAVGKGSSPLDLEYTAVSGDAAAEKTYSLIVDVG